MFVRDERIYLENNDLNDIFFIKDEARQVPGYIQNLIVDLLFKELRLKRKHYDLTKDLEMIDKNVIAKVITTIDGLYSNISKTNYEDKHLTYLWYYLSTNLYKVWQPLIDLLVTGSLKNNMQILDIGTGPASLPLGVIEFYKLIANNCKNEVFELCFDLVDSQAKFLEYAEFILEKIKQNLPFNLNINFNTIHLEIENRTNFLGECKYNIVSMSNFINHFEHEKSFNTFNFLKNLKNILIVDGSLIIIEPGSREECIAMKNLRNKLVNEGIYNVYSPCIPIWEKREKIDCACFSTYTMRFEKSQIIEFLHNKGLKKLKYKNHVAFNYLILRKDGLTKYHIENNKQSYYTLKEVLENEKDDFRVNIKGIIKKKSDKNNSFCVCDGSLKDKEYWIKIENTAIDELKENFFRLNMGEKVSLKKLRVLKINKQVYLSLDDKSKIVVLY